MNLIFSVPFGVFLVLMALVWEPQRKTKKDLAAEQRLILAGESLSPELSQYQVRHYLRRVMFRVLSFVIGVMAWGLALFSRSWQVNDTGALLILLGVYFSLILVVQRAEQKRRVLVLWTMGFVGFVLWRYADYRGTTTEHHLGLMGGVLANGLVWLLIGRRFPPGSSDAIEVIDKE